MKALSIRQPWCHRILNDGKDVENRNWYTNFRGPVLIYASKNFDLEHKDIVIQLGCPLGAIVGMVPITDCVTSHPSRWFFGKYGFVLGNPVALSTPVPCRGALKFFDVPPTVEHAVAYQLGLFHHEISIFFEGGHGP
ncbi:MAG: ASCH domain-containing protein [Rhodospirillaceae bacterium]